MSEPTPREILVHDAYNAIDACVMKLPMDEAHVAISQLREHLEARAEQTRPETDFADLLGL